MNENKTHGLSVNIGHYIHKYSHSIQDKGLVKFHHDITFGHDEISMLMADPEVYTAFLRHKLPVVCTDLTGRTLDNGIYLNSVLEAKYTESTIALKMLRDTALGTGLNYGTCSLHYAKKEENCQHLYSLFFDLSADDFLHFVVNNGSLIQDLISAYELASKDIILEAKSPQNRVILPNAHDYFASRGYPSSNVSKQLCVIHKTSGLPMHLSRQRGQCLLHFLSGKSIKVIAQNMGLSPKTIEHYLDMLRKELGCRTSKELIIHYAPQIHK